MTSLRLPRRALAAALLAPMAASPALAAAGEAKIDEADARVMEAANLIVPVAREGRLVNYLFVTVRVELAGGDVWSLKERSHFLRDALLRAAHRQDLSAKDSTSALDEATAIAAFTTAAHAALGERAVRAVAIGETNARRS